MKKGLSLSFFVFCSHSLYHVWASVVADCTDFSAHFFIDGSGGTPRIENLTAFVYPYCFVRTCCLFGRKHMHVCVHTHRHESV